MIGLTVSFFYLRFGGTELLGTSLVTDQEILLGSISLCFYFILASYVGIDV